MFFSLIFKIYVLLRVVILCYYYLLFPSTSS